MHTADYIIDVLLILVVIRQMRTRRLTFESTFLPVVLVVIAAASYLRAFTLGGNDLALIVVFAVIGAILGTSSAIATRVWRDDRGVILAKAGILAASLWIIGMGFRLGFSIFAYSNSGGRSLANFSLHHSITSGQAWTTALVLMALAEVLSRVGFLQVRRLKMGRQIAAA